MRDLTDLPKLDPNTLLTPPEIAEHLGVNRRTVLRWTKAKKFPNAQETRAGNVIPWGDVLAYLESKRK